jgi:DNA ligase (NAD+)
MTVSTHDEIRSLRTQLEHHNRLYYVDARPEISDLEYDQLLKRLQALEKAHPEYDDPASPSHKVGGQPIAGFVTVQHRQPMLSIDNVYDEKELKEFDTRIRKLLGPDEAIEYVVEYKIDGVALALIYENGKLTQALTRGDGQNGDDILHNARTIGGVPLQLSGPAVPPYIEIRGEAYISNADFAHIRAEQQRVGDVPFANPRNAAAGALKLLDPKLCKARKIRFFAHSVGVCEGIELPTHMAFLQAVKSLGVPVTPQVTVLPTWESTLDRCHEMMEELHELEFEVDGLVLKVNSMEQRARMGMTSKSPRWIIAFKWEKYEGITQVENISVQSGKTGTLTPVANLKPVEIAGTTVSRSSLHNRDELKRLGVKIGDWVVVEKAGKIIPHVVRVEEHRRTGQETEFVFPDHCPECHSKVIQDEGGVYIRCPNPACPAQLRETLRFYASRAAMDIEGLGTKLVELLTEQKMLTKLSDIYTLHLRRNELIELDRMGEKSVDNLLKGIEESKHRPLWRLLTGLNIRHIGRTVAQILANRFGTLDNIMAQSEYHLSLTPEIGPVIAKSVSTFFQSEPVIKLVQELKDQGLNFGQELAECAQAATASGPILGKTLVVTGTLTKFTRDSIKEFITEHGGKPTDSVSKNTDFLVAGEKAGSKLEKAQKLGIRILTEDEFIAFVKPGEPE